MTADLGCERVRELAPELALGIAAGPERDDALRHLTTCGECRRLVAELSTVGEELLLLAPALEPPADFESRVLHAIGNESQRGLEFVRSARPRPRRRWATALAAAAAIALSAVIGGGAVLVATGDDRRLADSYRTVLGVGQGSFFAAAALEGAAGRIGTVFAYQGDPSWVVVSLDTPFDAGRVFAVSVRTPDGEYVELGRAELGGEHAVWGARLPFDVTTVVGLRLVAEDGTAFTAAFDPSTSPWD
jgi:hypothetical protein